MDRWLYALATVCELAERNVANFQPLDRWQKESKLTTRSLGVFASIVLSVQTAPDMLIESLRLPGKAEFTCNILNSYSFWNNLIASQRSR